MKCPKCSYVGFEPADRCRNCGFNLSLGAATDLPLAPTSATPSGTGDQASIRRRDRARVTPVGPAGELPLHMPQSIAIDAEVDYLLRHDEPAPAAPALDLDRLLGVPNHDRGAVTPAAASAHREVSPATIAPERLPLFESEQEPVELRMVTPPPAGSPLAVRRSAPELPRTRSRGGPRPGKLNEGPLVTSAAEGARPRPASPLVPLPETPTAVVEPAGRVARTAAALIDTALLGGISIGVVTLTLRVLSLPGGEVGRLPLAPLSAFLLLLTSAYLLVFTVAGGRTVGKMLTGLRVVGTDGQTVQVAQACVRTLAALATVATAGLAFLPALLAQDRRDLADRMAGTQVVRFR